MSCSARTTCIARPSSSTRPRTAARSPRSSTRPCSTTRRCFPARLPARRETDVQRVGHDPDRLRQLVRILHRAGGARRRDQPSVRRCRRRGRRGWRREGVSEVTLLGQNVNSYGRDLQLAARQAGDRDARLRPMFAELLDGGWRGRWHPPRSLHQSASQRHARRDVCGDGGDACGVRAPALSAAVGQRSGSGVDAPRVHRAALPRTPRRRSRLRSPTSPCRPTSSSASRARPTTTSRPRSRSPLPRSTTTPTRSSSRRGPAPRRPR